MGRRVATLRAVRSRRRLAFAAAVVGACTVTAPSHAALGAMAFARPTYVDTTLPGGEPVVVALPSGTLVYAAHAGETHTDAPSLVGVASTTSTAAASRDQVFVWTSRDGGRSWQRLVDATGFGPPVQSDAGFSDPDFSVDRSGRLYGTSINPGYDSLFATGDSGRSWVGTDTCEEGDRPFIAAGRAGTVFLATSNDVKGEVLTASLDGGRSCLGTTIAAGTSTASGWQGTGKPVYDAVSDTLFLPRVATLPDGRSVIGVASLPHPGGVWTHPPASMNAGSTVAITTLGQRWPSLAADGRGRLYLAWDTSPTGTQPQTACTTSPLSPARTMPTSVEVSVSNDHGRSWSRPIVVARSQHTAFWPWIVAGGDGNAFVTWYQYDRQVVPFCAPADAQVSVTGALLRVGERGPRVERVPVSGRTIHRGAMCSGVGCIALGADRRMGDLFETSLDARGCVIVAVADTMQPDPLTGSPDAWAHPLFIRQNAGRSLTTGRPCG